MASLKGTTSKGFAYEIEDTNLDNMELIDALADLDKGNLLAISNVINLLLGTEQKKAFYSFYRNDEGKVPLNTVSEAITEILSNHNDLKN